MKEPTWLAAPFDAVLMPNFDGFVNYTITKQFGVDPDEITDPYGPVRRWHNPAYHINEAIDAFADRLALSATPASVGEVVEVLGDLIERVDCGCLDDERELHDRARALHDRLTGKDRAQSTDGQR